MKRNARAANAKSAPSPKKQATPKKASSPAKASPAPKPASPKAASPAKKSPAKKAAAPSANVSVTPYITIPGGRAGEAMDFYTKAFGAVVKRRLHDPSGKRVMHGEINIGKFQIFVNDEFMPSPHPPKSSIHLHVTDSENWWKRAMDAGCAEKMPLADQFWGDKFGQVEDPFGQAWSIASTNEVLTDAQMMDAQKKWFAAHPMPSGDKGKEESPAKKPAAAKKAAVPKKGKK